MGSRDVKESNAHFQQCKRLSMPFCIVKRRRNYACFDVDFITTDSLGMDAVIGKALSEFRLLYRASHPARRLNRKHLYDSIMVENEERSLTALLWLYVNDIYIVAKVFASLTDGFALRLMPILNDQSHWVKRGTLIKPAPTLHELMLNITIKGVVMTGSRPLNELEIQAILQAFSGKYDVRNRTLFLLGLNTGTRISELLSLDVGDVWRFGRPVDIIYLQKRHTKGKLVGRQITIKSGAQQAIFELILWKRQNQESLAKDAPLFVSRQGGRLKRKQAHNILKDAFDACELPGQVTTHSLRKTFANHVLRASGGNIKVLQELLGHQNLSTTEVYLSFELDELRAAVPDFNLDVSHVSSNSQKVITFQPPINTKKEAKRTS